MSKKIFKKTELITVSKQLLACYKITIV